MSEDVITSGPLFDGRAEHEIEDYTVHVKEKLAQVTHDAILNRLGEVIRVNHGVYESRIHIERQVDDLVVTDYPIVYGPWLEGVGSRNSPKTRFPGYFTFRIISQEMDARAQEIADREIKPYIAEMNA